MVLITCNSIICNISVMFFNDELWHDLSISWHWFTCIFHSSIPGHPSLFIIASFSFFNLTRQVFFYFTRAVSSFAQRKNSKITWCCSLLPGTHEASVRFTLETKTRRDAETNREPVESTGVPIMFSMSGCRLCNRQLPQRGDLRWNPNTRTWSQAQQTAVRGLVGGGKPAVIGFYKTPLHEIIPRSGKQHLLRFGILWSCFVSWNKEKNIEFITFLELVKEIQITFHKRIQQSWIYFFRFFSGSLVSFPSA